MDLEPQVKQEAIPSASEYAEPPKSKPLILLRDTEALLRRQTIETLTPIVPELVATRLQKASTVAEVGLNKLAEINLNEISDEELQPARILVGLTFIGLGALALLWLIVYLNTFHAELSRVEQIRNYWYQYIGFVCLGVAGMFMLARESMRSKSELTREEEEG